MAKPVALEARAELRETRGFISMTIIRPVLGSTANWMLQPPQVTPISVTQARAASRMRWYSLSVRVWAGATVMLSPVCTPMGSRFSIEQMTTKLSFVSRMTSSSYSFQPSTDSSMRISWRMLSERACSTWASNSSRLYEMAAPLPPRVKLARMIAGKPICSSAARASASEWQ
jgi:hypothetical protein